MISDLIQAIKGPKRMSFKHWRYRLLHWCFSVNPTNQYNSPLPRFLYTHYCPLFHLTNLIALFSPFIVVFKTVWFICRYTWVVLDAIARVVATIASFVAKKYRDRPRAELSQEQLDAALAKETELRLQRRRSEDRKLLVRLIRRNANLVDNFDELYYRWQDASDYKSLGAQEVKQLWEKVAPAIKAAEEHRQANEERRKRWLVFWVNFSRVFVKCTLNVLYVLLFAICAYALAFWVVPCLWFVAKLIVGFLCSLVWSDLVYVAKIVGKVLLGIGILAVVVAAIIKFFIWAKVLVKLSDSFVELGGAIAPPFVAIGSAVSACCRYCLGFFSGCAEFVAVFYEENCPPITIVSEEETEEDESCG